MAIDPGPEAPPATREYGGTGQVRTGDPIASGYTGNAAIVAEHWQSHAGPQASRRGDAECSR